MKETEITVQVFDDVQYVRNRLKELGYELKEEYCMTDWYFSKFEKRELIGMKYIDILNNSFLIREICDPNPRCQIVYKKKLMDDQDNVIQEEKFKVDVASSTNSIKVFTMSGLTNWCCVKNDSEVYKKGKTELALQYIKDLGLFIEYEEDDTMVDMSEKEKFEHMSEVIKTLGLNLGTDFSAKKVYMKFLQENASI